MRSFGYVYKHTNRINKKVYIGQSTEPPERRWRKGDKNYNSYKTCVAFYPALKKYSWDNFDSEILVWCSNLETLNRLEEFYIKYYNALAPNGYNTRSISDGRGKQADSTKWKISQKQINHNTKLREAGIVKISPKRRNHQIIEGIEYKVCTGCEKTLPLTRFGVKKDTWDGFLHDCRECRKLAMREYRDKNPQKKLSEQEWKQSYINRKEALRAGQKLRLQQNPEEFSKIKTQNQKIILRISLEDGSIKEYESGVAAKKDGFDNIYISQCCHGKRDSYKGYRWEFKKETGP